MRFSRKKHPQFIPRPLARLVRRIVQIQKLLGQRAADGMRGPQQRVVSVACCGRRAHVDAPSRRVVLPLVRHLPAEPALLPLLARPLLAGALYVGFGKEGSVVLAVVGPGRYITMQSIRCLSGETK